MPPSTPTPIPPDLTELEFGQLERATHESAPAAAIAEALGVLPRTAAPLGRTLLFIKTLFASAGSPPKPSDPPKRATGLSVAARSRSEAVTTTK